jgi:hypothetical protein
MALVITDAHKLMQISNLYQLLASVLSHHETWHFSTTHLNFLSLTLTHCFALFSPPQACILFRHFIQISVVYWGKLINAIIAERVFGTGEEKGEEEITTIATWIAHWSSGIPLLPAIQIKAVWEVLSRKMSPVPG